MSCQDSFLLFHFPDPFNTAITSSNLIALTAQVPTQHAVSQTKPLISRLLLCLCDQTWRWLNLTWCWVGVWLFDVITNCFALGGVTGTLSCTFLLANDNTSAAFTQWDESELSDGDWTKAAFASSCQSWYPRWESATVGVCWTCSGELFKLRMICLVVLSGARSVITVSPRSPCQRAQLVNCCVLLNGVSSPYSQTFLFLQSYRRSSIFRTEAPAAGSRRKQGSTSFYTHSKVKYSTGPCSLNFYSFCHITTNFSVLYGD